MTRFTCLADGFETIDQSSRRLHRRVTGNTCRIRMGTFQREGCIPVVVEPSRDPILGDMTTAAVNHPTALGCELAMVGVQVAVGTLGGGIGKDSLGHRPILRVTTQTGDILVGACQRKLSLFVGKTDFGPTRRIVADQANVSASGHGQVCQLLAVGIAMTSDTIVVFRMETPRGLTRCGMPPIVTGKTGNRPVNYRAGGSSPLGDVPLCNSPARNRSPRDSRHTPGEPLSIDPDVHPSGSRYTPGTWVCIGSLRACDSHCRRHLHACPPKGNGSRRGRIGPENNPARRWCCGN